MKRFSSIRLASAALVNLALFLGSGANGEDAPDNPRLLPANQPPGAWTLQWQGTQGRTYFVQNSHDLSTWTYLDTIHHGDGVKMEGVLSTAGKYFLRLRHTDIPCEDPETADFDADGLNNADELFWLCDPFLPDSDADGCKDGWEVMAAWNPNQKNSANGHLDPDGDGWDNTTEHTRGTNPNAADSDTDGLSDPDDADPNDATVDWPRAPEASRVWIPLTGYNPATHGAPVAVSNTGIALFEKAIWKNGVWKMLEWEKEGPTLSYTDESLVVSTTLRAIRALDLADDGRVLGSAELLFEDPYGAGDGEPGFFEHAVQWSDQDGEMVMEFAGLAMGPVMEAADYGTLPRPAGVSPDGILFTEGIEFEEPPDYGSGMAWTNGFQWRRHEPGQWKALPNQTFSIQQAEFVPSEILGGVWIQARNTIIGGKMGIQRSGNTPNPLLGQNGTTDLPAGQGSVCGALSDGRVAFVTHENGAWGFKLPPLDSSSAWRAVPKLAGAVAFNALGEAISHDGRFWSNGQWLDPVSEDSDPPSGLLRLHDINDQGVILASVGQAAGGGEGSSGLEHGAEAGLVMALGIKPNPLPLGGVARAKISLLFADKDSVPVSGLDGGPVFKIGNLECQNIHQDGLDPRVFYFTPPNSQGQSAGRLDFEISNITIPGCPWLSNGSTLVLKNLVEFTGDARAGTMAFMDSNIVRWEEAVSEVEIAGQNATITAEAAHEIINKHADLHARDQSGLAKLFFADKNIIDEEISAYEREIGRLTEAVALTYPVSPGGGVDYSLPSGVTVETLDISGVTEGEMVTFRFFRPDTSGGQLSISYALGGTSSMGYDYPLQTGSITFAESATYADLTVPISTDLEAEDPETLIVTLGHSMSYAVGYFDKASVTIEDGAAANASSASAGQPTAEEGLSLNPVGGVVSPQFGPTFFDQAKAMLAKTTKKTLMGTAVYTNPDETIGKMHYIVFDANSFKLKSVSNETAGATIENVRTDNASAEIILNGSLFNFKDKEPLVTMGRILNGGSAIGTSTNATKDSFAVAGSRYWFGQTLDKSIHKNAGQALSYQFGKGHPPEGGEIDHALGGLISLIFPEGHAQTAQDDADLDNYEAGWFTKPRGDLNKRLRGGVARLVPYNIIGVDRQSGMMIILSKPFKEPILLRDAQQALLVSGVDFALVTDGGGSVACWSKDWPHQGGYIAREHRQVGTPDAAETVTSYLIFQP